MNVSNALSFPIRCVLPGAYHLRNKGVHLPFHFAMCGIWLASDSHNRTFRPADICLRDTFLVRLVIHRYVITKVACKDHTFLTSMQKYYVTGLSSLPLGYFAKKLHMDKSLNPFNQHINLPFFMSWYPMR